MTEATKDVGPGDSTIPFPKKEKKGVDIGGRTIGKLSSKPHSEQIRKESEETQILFQKRVAGETSSTKQRTEQTSAKKPEEVSEVGKTITEATENRKELATLRQKALEDLKGQVPATTIARNLSDGMKKFLSRLYQEGLAKLGPPPCDFCVAALGSVARGESGPYPDYDNFMIIEKRTPKTIEYFIKLNQYVADRVHRLGEERVISELGDKRMYCGGLRFCMGELNSPYQVYEYRYSSKTKELEESRPEEQSRTISTLEASLKRPVYGGRAKLLESPEEVRSPLGDVADSTPIIGNPNLYERYMSTSLSGEKAEFTAISNIKRNIDGINKDKESPITAAKTELPILIHVKEQLFRFPQATVTSLALHYGIKEKNTIARINLLRDMGVFSVAFAERLKNSVEFLLKFRLQAQTAHREEFEYVSTGTWEEFSNHCEKIKATLSKIEREEAESGSTFGKEVEICNKKIRDLELQLSELEGKQGKEPEREKLKTHHEYQKQRFEELIDKDGLKEFCKDFLGAYSAKIEKNQYPDRVGTHPPALSAFSALDKAALEETVLPTLRDLFEMAKKSLSGGGFNPTPFSTK